MSTRDLSTADYDGILYAHAQRAEQERFAQLEIDDKWAPCSPLKDALLCVLIFLFATVPAFAFVYWVIL